MSTDAPRILVIKLGALGDFVQAFGPMAAIRRDHADAHITLLTTPPFAALGAASGYADEVWADDRPPMWQVGAWFRFRDRLRGAGFDRVYDLQTSDRTGWYFRLLGPGRRPEWSGIAAGCSHPHDNPGRDRMHTVERQAEQLHKAGIEAVPLPDVSWLTADTARFDLVAPYVLLVPGGAAHRPAKRWPAERYGELARMLVAAGRRVAVLGSAAEADLAATILAGAPGTVDVTGQTDFADIAALARGAEAAVGNDTGPMHLIAAAGARAVVLFSAESDPDLCAPRGRAVSVLRRDDLAALPLSDVFEALAIDPPNGND